MPVAPVRQISDWFPMNAQIWDAWGTFLLSLGLLCMANTRKSLIKPRSIAFQHQHGHCFYCNQPMWSDDLRDFVSKYGLTLKQAWYFQCTGEQLKAHSVGGSAHRSNIVAACRFCNQTRHRRKNPPDPIQYKRLVNSRMDKGRCQILRLTHWCLGEGALW